MKVMAQVSMVMNLDKCIGCHTCSVTCKNVWTNRPGAEYMWFNNVETKPGIGYPRSWEDQEKWNGGWELNKRGNLQLKGGGKLQKLANIFFNPDLPSIDDYYDPWTYDYENLIGAPKQKHQPVARPISQITGKPTDVEWGPNWEDDLSGSQETAPQDPNIRGELEESIKMEYEQVFMMYLPRICNHCVNTTCMASCPSGAIYKREEDGIILIDQEACRGWRMCVSGCPYKKVFFNWKTGKAEKCTLCYPRIEAGMPTVCAETCVGRIRYMGLLLYDGDKIEEVASTPNERDLIDAQLDMLLDPNDPDVARQALKDGVARDWIDAAKRSPVYKLVKEHKVALPLHPEFRTIPMIWYVPPLSPVMGAIESEGSGSDPDDVFPAIESMRIPIQYLANLFSAGDEQRIRVVLRKLAAMRSYMRELNISGDEKGKTSEAAGIDVASIKELYRILAIAKYDDRFVIPKRHGEIGENPMQRQGMCGLDFAGGPGTCGAQAGQPQADNVAFEQPLVEEAPPTLNLIEAAAGKSKLNQNGER